ncbi:outer membrane autotransporter barrel domain protein [Sutterella sp. CAG:521]|nr:outer membrane autotransporter barrel domain protein [Sutterella sp. CAG:521]
MKVCQLTPICHSLALIFSLTLFSSSVLAAPAESSSGLYADGSDNKISVDGNIKFPDGRISGVESGVTVTKNSSNNLVGSASLTTDKVEIQTNHYGIWKDGENSKVNIGNSNSEISIDVSGGMLNSYGVYATDLGEVNLKGSTVGITVDFAGTNGVAARAISINKDTQVHVDASTISLTATDMISKINNYAVAAEVKNNGKLFLGNEDTVMVSLTAQSGMDDNKGGVNTNRISSAVSTSGGGVSVLGNEIYLNAEGYDAAGINVSNNGEVNLGDKSTSKVQITTSANTEPKDKPEYEATRISSAITSSSGTVEILGSEILFDTTGYASTTLAAAKGAQIKVGDDSSTINVVTAATDSAIGLRSEGENSLVDIDADTLSISVTSTEGVGIGLMALNATQNEKLPDNASSINIKANSTSIQASSLGIAAFSNSHVYLDTSLIINAPTAVEARGNSLVKVNPFGDKAVQINGDISFATEPTSSGDILNADVQMNLSGADSFWTGNIKVDYPESADVDKEINKGVTLSLSDNAQWNVTEIDTSSPSGQTVEGIPLNTLNLNDGVVNLTTNTQVLEINTVSGTGGTFNLPTKIDGDVFSSAEVQIQRVSSDTTPQFNVNYTGITADDLKGTGLSEIEGGVTADGAAKTLHVNQGAILGAVTETYNAEGERTSRTVAENTRLDAYGSVAALSIMQWRHEMNDLTKRMGELRTSPEGIGSWARIYGSEQEYGSQNLTAKNTSVQIGADTDVGNGWKVGAAFTYTDGSADYDLGDADNKAYGLGVYGTWMADNGQFVDLIAKYSRLDTDFKLEGMNGSSDNNAFSVSAEYGWHLRLGEFGFFEPQAEVTYGYIQGDKFHTSNGVEIDQDDFESLIGRIGFRTGFHFPKDKGLIYARVSGLHDFKGDFDSTATLMSDRSIYDNIGEDLGDTWVEFGIGANFNWTPSTYTYVDLERTNGGDVKENWRWNIGLRHVF